ncbi:hypothetical protein LSCM1_02808 [Leishmania martiniquensis]|uniref:Uncharacterized protein n=1 Tax=Leishmania martiniquensis TaxID=1580590 RepID=A0A836KL00_9TRYP|nr:hypothetical protein LSCM1_02808 [Leishmania martiniquensis]
MNTSKSTGSSSKSRSASGRRLSGGESSSHKSGRKLSDRASSSSGRHRSSSRSSGEHKRSYSSKPAAPSAGAASATATASRPASATPKSGSTVASKSAVKPAASRALPAATIPSSAQNSGGAPPNGAPAIMPSSGTKPTGTGEGGTGPNIQPIGGSMRGGLNGMYGPSTASGYGSLGNNQNGMLCAFGSIGGAQNVMNGCGFMGPSRLSGYGSMGGNQKGMMNAFGSMGAAQDGMGGYGSMAGGGPEGMDGLGCPMGSMYGMGGSMGSMYGMGGPMGSMYGMGGSMGSMYGMGGPMGSMYGMGGPMGSMYGMGGPMGSMYGMGGPMGSMYGMGGGSLYGACYQSVVDAASRRDSFLNKNDLIRAEVKPLKSSVDAKEASGKGEGDEKDSKHSEAQIEERKKDAKDLEVAAKKEGSEKKESTDKKPSAPPKPADADAKVAKGCADTKASEADKKDLKDKGGEKKDSEAPVAKSDGPLKLSGTKIRSLALICKSGKEAKVTVKGRDTVFMDGKETLLDEAVLIEDPKKPVEAAALSEVRNQWVSGHNTTIMVGSDDTRRAQAVNFMCEYLSTCTGKLAASGEYFSIYITMTALDGADQGRDLLKDGAVFERLLLSSSPVYGPALNKMTVKEVNTKETMEAALKEGMGRAKESEMVCSYLVLKQCRKSSAGTMVYLSSLNVTLVGPNVEHLTGLKAKKAEEPCRLYRYSIGGGSHTVCVGFVSDDEASAAKVFAALKEMREVENSEPRSGNVKRFIEYTKKEIPKCKEKIAATTEESKKANYETMLRRMEMMLKDAEDIERDPKTVAPKAYV